MILQELIDALPGARIAGGGAGGGTPITAVAHRADRAEPGTLFCAVRGLTADGHDFAAEAAARGASALLVERELPGLAVPQVVVADVRPAMGLAAAAIQGHPSRPSTWWG